MTLKYITREHSLYKEAVVIRTKCFFNGMENQSQLINDADEVDGLHLVCLNDKGKVIGTGRLNIKENNGIISQMAVEEQHQKQGIGALILIELLNKCKRENVNIVTLNARETALAFYKKYDFKVIGEKYPSKKTGIIHQKMILSI